MFPPQLYTLAGLLEGQCWQEKVLSQPPHSPAFFANPSNAQPGLSLRSRRCLPLPTLVLGPRHAASTSLQENGRQQQPLITLIELRSTPSILFLAICMTPVQAMPARTPTAVRNSYRSEHHATASLFCFHPRSYAHDPYPYPTCMFVAHALSVESALFCS
jgi:hypothetical protein